MGFCNTQKYFGVSDDQKLLYPLICGLLQQGEIVLFENENAVVIPTHMWASATAIKYGLVDKIVVVIPTHMWASATSCI